MSDLDAELLERVQRWCAEAGRQTGPAEIRAALAPLGWDALLNLRALLADPPPARPLGPHALADLARGTPADVAAERERGGRYRPEGDEAKLPEGKVEVPAVAPKAEGKRPRRGGPRQPASPVVHRKRDRVAPSPEPAERHPLIDELREPAGRGVLERLLRAHGARRSFLLAGLAGWRRPDGAGPTDLDLDALLDHHGLARAFAHRERDELLHALRAVRGERAAAAARVGLSPEDFQAALVRLGAAADAERLREERRDDLRSRATIAERCRMLLEEPDRLTDLGLLAELEADLRARLPEHLRALRAGDPRTPLREAFARSIDLPPASAARLGVRLGLDLGKEGPADGAPRHRSAGPRPRGPRAAKGPGANRPLRRGIPRTGGTSGPRRGTSRPGRPLGSRPAAPPRKGGRAGEGAAQRGRPSLPPRPRGGHPAKRRPPR